MGKIRSSRSNRRLLKHFATFTLCRCRQNWSQRWSYGINVSNLLLKGADSSKCAIAVAPVTTGEFYDSSSTEKIHANSQENPEYDDNPNHHVG